MHKNNKGFSLISAIVVLAIVGAVVLIAAFLGNGGFGKGGGEGDKEGTRTQVEAPTDAPTEIPPSPTPEQIDYIDITVSGNEYLYQNRVISLEDLIAKLTEAPLTCPVKLTDDNSSLRAYKQLKEALVENAIRYIEASPAN